MPASQADVGLPPKLSSPVKVIGATCLGKSLPDGRPDYYDPENWILELESPMMCYKGRLSTNDPKSWTPRIRVALKIPHESYLMEQQHCLDIDANGKPHEHFRWYMYVSDFVQYFTEVWVYYKSHQFPFKVSYDGFHNQTALNSTKKQATGKEVCEWNCISIIYSRNCKVSPFDFSAGRPCLLRVDTPVETTIIVTFSIAPEKTAPRVLKQG